MLVHVAIWYNISKIFLGTNKWTDICLTWLCERHRFLLCPHDMTRSPTPSSHAHHDDDHRDGDTQQHQNPDDDPDNGAYTAYRGHSGRRRIKICSKVKK